MPKCIPIPPGSFMIARVRITALYVPSGLFAFINIWYKYNKVKQIYEIQS